MRLPFSLIAAGAVAAVSFAPSLAEARPHCWGYGCGWGPRYYAPGPIYVAPRPVYVAPPPVYYAPPPVYYGPPAYYAPRAVLAPSVSLGINIPLR